MSTYEQSGVSIDAGQEAVDLIKGAVKATQGDEVVAGIGAFGGLFALNDLPEAPVLVASTDGVGTKVKLAADLGRVRGVGMDIVNHCLNDLACAGSGFKPLFFLDYYATSKLDPKLMAEVVQGMSDACVASGCAILGGETAEMPGVYAENAFDIVGTMIGLVGRDGVFEKDGVQEGDVLFALPSSGPHTNGYSLIRAIVEGQDMAQDMGGVSLGDALLAPHRSYLHEIHQLEQGGVTPKVLAHITGGGITENLPRVLPEGLTGAINLESWDIPPLFQFLGREGNVAQAEMFRVFNMGVGMIFVLAPDHAERTQELLPEGWVVGTIAAGNDVTYG